MEKWWVGGVFPGRSSALGVVVLAGEGFQCDPYCLRDCTLAILLLSIPNTPNAGPGARVPQEEILHFGKGSWTGR